MRNICYMTLLLALAACFPLSTAEPDNRIKVSVSPSGEYVATPPECLSWAKYESSPFDNHAWPQMGCSTARNLAIMVDNPKDLVAGQDAGPAEGTIAAKSVELYRKGKTKDLINPFSATDTSSSGNSSSGSD